MKKNMKKILLLAIMALVLCAELSAQANQSAWTVQKKENEDYTSYLFITKGSGEHFIFVGYDKYKSIGGSCVRAGVYWVPKAVDVGGSYDIKDDEGTKETKDFSWAWWSYSFGWGHPWSKYGQGFLPYGSRNSEEGVPGDDGNATASTVTQIIRNDNRFAFTYNNGESARFWVERILRNNFLAVKHNGENYRFQTSGFLQVLEKQGITKEELMNVIANDEF